MEGNRWVLFGGSVVIAFLLGILIGRGTVEPEVVPQVVTSYVPKEVRVPCQEPSILDASGTSEKKREATAAKAESSDNTLPVRDEALPQKEKMTVLASVADDSHRFYIELVTPGKVSLEKLSQTMLISGQLEKTGMATPFTLLLSHNIMSGEFPVMMRVTNLKEDEIMTEEVYCFQSMKEGYYYDIRVQTDGFINCMVEREYKRPDFGGGLKMDDILKNLKTDGRVPLNKDH